MITVGPTQTQIFTALRGALNTFGLVTAAGAALPIIRGQVNRVPEPGSPDFIVMWPIMRQPLSMDVATSTDTILTGSIASAVLTVSDISGNLQAGQGVYAIVSSAWTLLGSIGAQLSGATGGLGTYSLPGAANRASGTLYAGTRALLVPEAVTIQADIHGPTGADNCARIIALFRDQFCTDALAASGYDVAPLYLSDPRQLPFENGEQQTEERWTIDLALQVNSITTTPQQFAGGLQARAIPIKLAFASLTTESGFPALSETGEPLQPG